MYAYIQVPGSVYMGSNVMLLEEVTRRIGCHIYIHTHTYIYTCIQFPGSVYMGSNVMLLEDVTRRIGCTCTYIHKSTHKHTHTRTHTYTCRFQDLYTWEAM